VPPLALIHGFDAHALDETIDAVSRALFPDPTLAALGREVLDARETTPAAIALAAETLPLGVTMRLVAVRHCQVWGAKDTDPLRAYVRQPAASTCLLLLADELLTPHRVGDSDRKTPHWLVDAVPADAVITLAPLEGARLREWLRQRAGDDGYRLSDDAARLLIQWTGEDRVRLLAELRKAALAGGPDNTAIGEKEVRAVVGEHRMDGVFDLTRAVEQGDVAKGVATLDRLLATEEPMAILYFLARDIRRALSVREWTARGQRPDQIARMLRVPPRVAEALVARARGPAGERLPRQLARCWEVELRLKSRGQPRAELTALVAELCAGA
jgi:DNA polymerase III delta subunit